MKVLLDTNIVIHREANRAVREDIGVLFRWLDNLHYSKCIHPITVQEIEKHSDPHVVRSFKIKMGNYNVLQTVAPALQDVARICAPLDKSDNDRNDTSLLNELASGRVDALITEDKLISTKAALLGLADQVFSIEKFLEKVTSENPALADYKVLAVRKTLFGKVSVDESFFQSFKSDYPGFEKWFNRKSEEEVYVCQSEGKLLAFLYLKAEGEDESYPDISPQFTRKKRLKIGTFKVELNGYKLGERFLKIVFDNAMLLKVDEIYVTIFDHSPEHHRLIELLEEYGFVRHGTKTTAGGEELVYIRDFSPAFNPVDPKKTFPYLSPKTATYLVSINPEYHTELLPDAILNTESPADYIENEPHRNAISKVFISRSLERDLKPGDKIVFYRTAGAEGNAIHRSVVTAIGIVERVILDIPNEAEFIQACGKRSVFSAEKLSEWWNAKPYSRPFVVHFLNARTFPKRPNLKTLIDLGVIANARSAPRGFTKISPQQLKAILKEAQVL